MSVTADGTRPQRALVLLGGGADAKVGVEGAEQVAVGRFGGRAGRGRAGLARGVHSAGGETAGAGTGSPAAVAVAASGTARRLGLDRLASLVRHVNQGIGPPMKWLK